MSELNPKPEPVEMGPAVSSLMAVKDADELVSPKLRNVYVTALTTYV